jgi:hypothetical protein
LTHPAEFSDAVKAMADAGSAVESGANGDETTGGVGANPAGSSSSASAAPPPPALKEPEEELSEEEKRHRHIEEQMRVCFLVFLVFFCQLLSCTY